MSTSDQAYQRRQRRECSAAPGRVGHLGYELTAAGGLREIGPVRCPNRCQDARWLVGWDGQHRYYICQICRAEALFCGCRSYAFAYEGRTEPLAAEVVWLSAQIKSVLTPNKCQ